MVYYETECERWYQRHMLTETWRDVFIFATWFSRLTQFCLYNQLCNNK